MEVTKLDSQKLGQILIRGVLTAHRSGEQKFSRAIMASAFSNPEGDFIRDLLVMDIDEIIKKWYGGASEVGSIIHAVKAGAQG